MLGVRYVIQSTVGRIVLRNVLRMFCNVIRRGSGWKDLHHIFRKVTLDPVWRTDWRKLRLKTED